MDDAKLLRQGFFLLLFVVFVGIWAAEGQINDLTQRQKFIQFFNVFSEPDGRYKVYLLGEKFNLRQTYTVGHFYSRDQTLYLGGESFLVSIPCSYGFSFMAPDPWLMAQEAWLTPKVWAGKQLIDFERERLVQAVGSWLGER